MRIVRYAPLETANGRHDRDREAPAPEGRLHRDAQGCDGPQCRRGAEGHRTLRAARQAAGAGRRTRSTCRPHRPAAWCSPAERLLGEIVDVANYGAGDLIDVKIEGRRDTVLIPFASRLSCRSRMATDDRRRPARGLSRRGGRKQHDLPRHRADALSGDVPGAARPLAGRARAGDRASGRSRRATSAPQPPTGTGRWTTIPRAAAPAWC